MADLLFWMVKHHLTVDMVLDLIYYQLHSHLDRERPWLTIEAVLVVIVAAAPFQPDVNCSRGQRELTSSPLDLVSESCAALLSFQTRKYRIWLRRRCCAGQSPRHSPGTLSSGATFVSVGLWQTQYFVPYHHHFKFQTVQQVGLGPLLEFNPLACL